MKIGVAWKERVKLRKDSSAERLLPHLLKLPVIGVEEADG